MSFANPTSASRGCDYVFCSTKEYSVILGTSKLKPLQAALIPVKDIIMHPKFWGRTFIMGDVALLHLHSPATFTKYVQPICLPEPSYDLKVGTQCWVTGWGQVKQRFSGERAGCRGGVWNHGGGAALLLGPCRLDPFMVPLRKLVAVTSGAWFFGWVRTLRRWRPFPRSTPLCLLGAPHSGLEAPGLGTIFCLLQKLGVRKSDTYSPTHSFN